MGLTWAELRVILIVALCVGSATAAPLLIFERRAKRSMRWLLCWGALALLGPAAAWTLADEDHPPPLLTDSEFPALLKGVPESVRIDVAHSPAVTDKGYPLRLQTAPGVHFDPDEFNRLQTDLLEHLGMTDAVTPLPLGWQNSNCHGWIFTGGTFFVVNDEVQTILDDNGYESVASPRASDIAIYRNSQGNIIHTGLVRFTGLNTVVVESKWGHCGVFLHPSHVHPYQPVECTFYRSNRTGHILNGLPEGSAVGGY